MKYFKLLTLLLLFVLGLTACDDLNKFNTDIDDSKTDLPTSVTISFDSMGGTPIEPISILIDDSLTMPEDPTKEGFDFIGWYISTDFTDSFDDTFLDLEEITIYAKWDIQIFTVSFIVNGGSELSDLTFEYNQQLVLDDTSLKDGATFVKWHTNIELTNEYDMTTKITEDITLYAEWDIQTFTISFVVNGGSELSDLTFEYNQQLVLDDTSLRDGATFVKWHTNIELTNEYDMTTRITEDITLYAEWLVSSVSLTFDSHGGSGVGTITNDYNTIFVEPTAPINGDLVFLGWYSDKLLLNEFDFDLPVTEGQTLYAKWNKETFIVAISTNNESAHISGNLELFRTYLEDAFAAKGFNYNLIVKTLDDYTITEEDLLSGYIDIAYVEEDLYLSLTEGGSSPLEAILANVRYAYNKNSDNPIDWNDGVPIDYDQQNFTPYYNGLIIAGTSQAARTVADKINAGETLVWDDVKDLNWCVRSTTSNVGYVYPNYWLMSNFDGKTFNDLSNVVETTGYSDTISKLASGACDLGTIYVGARINDEDRWTEEYGRTESIWLETDVIGITEKHYHDPIIINSNNIDANLKIAIEEIFTELSETDDGRNILNTYNIKGFTLVDDSNYDTYRLIILEE